MTRLRQENKGGERRGDEGANWQSQTKREGGGKLVISSQRINNRLITQRPIISTLQTLVNAHEQLGNHW